MSWKCSKIPRDLNQVPHPYSCKATDKERAWLDRISLSDVSFSVANKPKGKINRVRKRNKQPGFCCPQWADCTTGPKRAKQHGASCRGLVGEPLVPAFPPKSAGSSWLLEGSSSTVTCFVQKYVRKNDTWHFGRMFEGPVLKADVLSCHADGGSLC